MVDLGAIPGPIQIPDAWQVRLRWSLTNGKTASNVLYGQHSAATAPTPANADALFTAIKTGAGWTTLAAFLAPGTQLLGVSLLDVRVPNNVQVDSSGLAAPGTSASTALPDEVCLVYTIRTAKSGPGGRGRIFIPGWATNALGTNGVVAGAAVTALTSWVAGTLSTAINTNVGQACLGLQARAAYTSPVTGRVFPARAATTIPWSAAGGVNNRWDTQRKRGLR
jgi:hypothetical protein